MSSLEPIKRETGGFKPLLSAAAACNVHSVFLHLMHAQLVWTREGDPVVATRNVLDALEYVQRRTDAEEGK